MKKLAYGMLFGMSLLVGCEPHKTEKPAATPENKATTDDKGGEMKGPEAPAETPAEPAGEKKE